MSTRPNGHIWMVAEEFYNAAECIWDSNYSYPLLVNYAFACELALKSAEGKIKQPAPLVNG